MILIPVYGTIGAAIASVATQTLTAIAQLIIACRFFKFKFNYNIIVLLIIFIILIYGIAYITKNIFENWLYGFIALIFSSFIIAFITRLISLKNLYLIIKYDKDDI